MKATRLLLTLTLLAAWLGVVPATGADTESQHFRLIYIDHETKALPEKTGDLCEELNRLRDNALQSGDALIIYLSCGESPVVSLTNLKDFDDKDHHDDDDAFSEIIYQLQSFSNLKVSPALDRDNLTKLLSEHYPIVDNDGKMQFKSVTLDFYVGPRFWTLKYNERIIANLFVNLDMKSIMQKYPRKTQMAFNVWKPEGDELSYSDDMPFGVSNVDGINDKVFINEY